MGARKLPNKDGGESEVRLNRVRLLGQIIGYRARLITTMSTHRHIRWARGTSGQDAAGAEWQQSRGSVRESGTSDNNLTTRRKNFAVPPPPPTTPPPRTALVCAVCVKVMVYFIHVSIRVHLASLSSPPASASAGNTGRRENSNKCTGLKGRG